MSRSTSFPTRHKTIRPIIWALQTAHRSPSSQCPHATDRGACVAIDFERFCAVRSLLRLAEAVFRRFAHSIELAVGGQLLHAR
jgi:hypothetical protein